MPEIMKIYKSSLPALRLVGKRYPNASFQNGDYTATWEEWFQKQWFEPLQKLDLIDDEGDAYIGSTLVNSTGTYDYWIGMFAKAGSPVPEGYEYIDIPAGETAVIWLKGQDDFELYSRHELCVETWKKEGYPITGTTGFTSRYTQSKFTQPDENGDVILEYCAHL